MCTKCIASTDKSDTVRRAAVMVIEFLLQGVTGNSFMVSYHHKSFSDLSFLDFKSSHTFFFFLLS